MIAPSQKRNDMVQIQVTSSCDIGTCSNCVYAVAYRPVKHMSLDCFRAALRSVLDCPGFVCLMGGNPCLHPRFEELCEILCEEIPDQHHRGIVTDNVLRHGDLVKSVFWPRGRMLLNAHGKVDVARRLQALFPNQIVNGHDGKPARHAPLLVDWMDLGFSPEEWEGLREDCDIMKNWSCGIAERDGKPKGYFCEVAGIIDELTGEDHGVPAVPGWWRQPMEHFEAQVSGCCDRGCGVPLKQIGHFDHEGVYGVSRSWAAALGNPRLPDVRVYPHNNPSRPVRDVTDYMRYRGGDYKEDPKCAS